MIDFVIPLHKNNIIIRTVVEGIINFYNPINIYIITSEISIKELNLNILHWIINKTKIILIDEFYFFVENYHLTRDDIEKWYLYKDEESREFGWWYQQIIKLGAIHQIKNISDPCVVWDSDLIPIKKWNIYPTEDELFYKFAILQYKEKNELNKLEYSKSLFNLLNIPEYKINVGTMVPHHFILHHIVINNLIKYINDFHNINWIEKIISLSHKYYRFSEYKCIATYMHKFYPNFLQYHEYHLFGENGIRYRCNKEIIKDIYEKCFISNYGLEYTIFYNYTINNSSNIPSYIQIEHL